MNGIAVLGAGESGVGAAVLAKTRGIPVFVSDSNPVKEKYKNVLKKYEIEFEEGRHSIERLLSADEVIKSPGIPDHISLIKTIAGKGIPVVSEIEFAAGFTNAFLICITGSNGKTSTTGLTWYLLKEAGLNAGLAGNIGSSFAMEVALHQRDFYVLEISSFQLDGMFRFKADIAVLLNITPDHLDRYDDDFGKYASSKFRITQNQTTEDAFIYCADDPVIINKMQHMNLNARLFPFSLSNEETKQGAWLSNNELNIKTNDNLFNMNIEQLALQGRHNVYNSMAAGLSASLIGLRKQTIRQCLSTFQNVPHRLEYVANVHGVEYINDSKATNVNSTWWALENARKPVIWIAGGLDKGNDYSSLTGLVKQKVKALICLGVDNSKIYNAFADVVPQIHQAASMAEAIQTAYYVAEKDEMVLLSPVCASFDLFENYEDRGNQFKELVMKL